jgi:hypothetical protein
MAHAGNNLAVDGGAGRSLPKEDLVFIARSRKLAHTPRSLWQMKIPELNSLVGEISHEEHEKLAKTHDARRTSVYWGYTVGELIARVRERSIAYSSMTRGALIDELLQSDANGFRTVVLDPSQEDALKRSDGALRLLISAGPGSGKTTTVCEIVRHAARKPDARIIVLAFNVKAEDTLKKNLRRGGPLQMIHKSRIHDPAEKGCAVLTFDKLGFQVNAAAERESYADCLFEDDTDPSDDDAVAPIAESGAVAATPSDTTQQSSYRLQLERAAAYIARNGFGHWTHVVIDEAQDVDETKSVFIDALCAGTGNEPRPQLIAAGDPRQELYAGATWFSNLWVSTPEDEKAVLKFNHRSAPAIVDAINAISRAHFPLTHYDQIAARTGAAGSVKIIPVRGDRKTIKTRIGYECGMILSACAPGSAYAVAPISINAWGLDMATTAARQTLAAERPGSYLIMLDGAIEPGTPTHAYEIATSSKIKGTERSTVVVFGGDLDYSISVSLAQQLKSLFVALSRARDELVVLIHDESSRVGICDSNRLKPLIDLFAPNCARAGPPRSLPINYQLCARVAMDYGDARGLSSVEGALVAATSVGVATPTINISPTEFDADFTGCYTEALVAHSLGVPLANSHCVSVELASPADPRGFYSYTHPESGQIRYVIRAPRSRIEAVRSGIATLADSHYSAPYLHTVIKYSLLAGDVWTVSERLASLAGDAGEAAVAAYILERCGRDADDIKYNEGCSLNLPASRPENSTKFLPVVLGVPDLIIGGVPVELKHVRALMDCHRRQAAIYATMLNAPRALLVNTLASESEWVSAMDLRELTCIGRASIAISNARSRANGALARMTISPPSGLAAVVISFDYEHQAFGDRLITEIGAVAFSHADGVVISTFDERADGVIELDAVAAAASSDFDSRFTALHVANEKDMIDGQQRLLDRFASWVKKHTVRRTYMHWGGGERACLEDHLPSGNWVDAMHGAFRPWLSAGGDSRLQIKLKDAVSQVMPGYEFEYHRAFEDAVATAAVFQAVVNSSGAL